MPNPHVSPLTEQHPLSVQMVLSFSPISFSLKHRPNQLSLSLSVSPMSPASVSHQKIHFLSLLSLLCLTTSSLSSDLQLLLTVKTALKSSNTDVFTTWDSKNSIFNFTGITCNPDGSVKSIDLSNQGLTGTVPLDSICQLQSLERLSLGMNSLNGRLTEDLRNCVNLRFLDVSNNQFSGELPDFSPLSGLTDLYMNCSGFSGVFPFDSLSNMTGLRTLSIGDNPFDRTLFPASILGLTQLNWLYMSNCSIEGQIPPGIGNLTELIELELSSNYLTGEIPPEISKLKKLWQLEIYSNSLTGKFPAGFGNLTKIENLDVSLNNLEGDLSELGSMTEMVTLQAFENHFIGEIPAEFGEFKKLVNLSLYTNQLTGPLPQKIGSWADFIYIDVSENFLTGPIPPDMCKNGKMTKILMLQNKFTGGLPASYSTCTSLNRIRVSNNSLSGVVPSGIWGLPNVGLLDLSLNQFEGSITSEIETANSLSQLYLFNNRFSGEIPPEISKASSLTAIELGYNQFSGPIPASIGELKLLNTLDLPNNNLSGHIPASLGSCVVLNDVNLGLNSLSGEIPASIGSLHTLNSLNLTGNDLSGQIPASLSFMRLSLLDLSNNRLSGPIPQSLNIEAYNGSFAGNNGLCSQNIKYFRRCSPASSTHQDLRLIIIGVVIGVVLLLGSVSCFLYLKRTRKDDRERSLKEESWDVKSFHILTFTEDDILDSIKQENVIGKGGSGNVYKVVLANDKEFAVKHIWNSDFGGGKGFSGHRGTSTPMLKKRGKVSREFEAEVETLSSIRHVNVVKLYCSITSEDSSLLVYEYMHNGSLWDQLHGCGKKITALDWVKRYDIAVGAAKGLEYLHHGCGRPVIHRDVKSSNILLDEDLKPRIADFGLAKIVQANASKDSTQVIAGTLGYIAPEYGYTYKVSEKSDVYSFGVVLMELVTGKRPIEPEFGENKDIVTWVSGNLKSRESVTGMLDSTIEEEAYKESAIKVLRIAILCTARLPPMRPTMRSVVQMLEEAEACRFFSIIVDKDGGGKKEDVK